MRTTGRAAALLALVALQLGCAPGRSQAQVTACPVLPDDPLQFVDVFDGSPEEEAFLVPDSATDERGSWSLGYVYDAGRFVTVRCKYARAKPIDLKITTRIAQCQYTTERATGLKMACQ